MTTRATKNSINELMSKMGHAARASAAQLRQATTEAKNTALIETAKAIADNEADILKSNQLDLLKAKEKGLSGAMVDRLALDDERLSGIVASLHSIAALPDPVGKLMEQTSRPNGLQIERIRTPIGVIAIIYESRPNVTIDAGALCLKSGNSAILRGGSEAIETSKALYQCLAAGLRKAGLPESAVQFVPTTDRDAVAAILAGLNGNIDLIIPRGGKSLVQRVQEEARAPVLSHLDGICHLYVDGDADLAKATAIVVNSKMRRTGVCGAVETLLIDKTILGEFFPMISKALQENGCAIKGDSATCAIDASIEPATDQDFHTEYLDAVISVAAVNGVDGAIDHIAHFSSAHTESIITENAATAQKFITAVDSAIVMHNASTQFADGGEFGLGAEIGIATGRLHARGPVGLEELTTYKNVVRGVDHIRP